MEKEITTEETNALLKHCEPTIIDYVRYKAQVEHYTFEINEFFEENTGLVIVEIELKHEKVIFKNLLIGR